MYIIPITPFTLDLVEELSGGIRPKIEQEPTYYLFAIRKVDKRHFQTIIGDEEYKALSGDRTNITFNYISG